ncbi:hypothetical protein [Ponticaulis sp.]|uniref:hypothetical protein n=1 Tax=Ponticaulis sp. TaxID=2020902 RepID=UPI000B645F17|nr:hypothetical protein [Ponticaulis sp.]MAI88882.1 hypothetical protein [Ponticaulis sp.]OUY01573.1 MAG: hypothetical protein CBB65_00185 [Hyphomonadaceae bacterium TMED5]
MSKNTKRAPYSDKVKARCREMREQGYSNVQITEATSVPGSTIARWAAEGGWRVRDLIEEPAFNAPETPPDGLLPGLGGEGWGEPPSPSEGEGLGGRETIRPQTSESEAASELPLNPNPSSLEGEKGSSTKSRQQQLEDALEKAAIAAEDAILKANFAAAGKATQMADTLSRALERVRNSAVEEKPDGVFYTQEDIQSAREELMHRFNRLARVMGEEHLTE